MSDLERRLQEAAAEVRQMSRDSMPPPVSDERRRRVHPGFVFAAAFVAVIVVFGIIPFVSSGGDEQPLLDVASNSAPSTAPESESAVPESTVPDSTAPAASGACSAADLPPEPTPILDGDEAEYSVPHPVAETRIVLAALAVACDYEGLADLAAGDDTMVGSPDLGVEDVAAYLREREEEGEPVMMILRMLLETRPQVETYESAQAIHVIWPQLARLDPNVAEDADQVETAVDDLVATGLLTAEEVDSLLLEEGWLGWRLGIADEDDRGRWTFFVAGD